MLLIKLASLFPISSTVTPFTSTMDRLVMSASCAPQKYKWALPQPAAVPISGLNSGRSLWRQQPQELSAIEPVEKTEQTINKQELWET